MWIKLVFYVYSFDELIVWSAILHILFIFFRILKFKDLIHV
jgi:hypothetical protein